MRAIHTATLMLASVAAGQTPAAQTTTVAPEETTFADYADIRIGTNSFDTLSHGNTLPLVMRPWGFNSFGPETVYDGGAWWFHPEQGFLRGFRLTHQPSPWIGDWGHLNINIYAGRQVTDEWRDWGDYSAIDVFGEDTKWTPYHWKSPIWSGGSVNGPPILEMTPTVHAAVFRLTLPEYEDTDTDIIHPQVYIQAPDDLMPAEQCDFDDTTRCLAAVVDESNMSVYGGTRVGSGGKEANFLLYYYAEMTTDATIKDKFGGNSEAAYGGFRFSPGGTSIELRIATSLISKEQAQLNFDREVRGRSFEDVLQESKDVWNATLGAIDVEDVGSDSPLVDEERKRVFYSSLYRAALFPREISEVDAQGRQVHYSPYDNEGAVYEGPLSTDSGFWDAYHTVYGLQSLLWPERYLETMKGYLNNYREGGGWIAQWSSPGFKNSMVGSMSDNILADAIVKGILTDPTDLEDAWKAIRNNCYETPDLTTGDVPGHVRPTPLFSRPDPLRPPRTVIEPPSKHAHPKSTTKGTCTADGCDLKGRRCLDGYLGKGYVAYGCSDYAGDVHEVVSRTLNYANSDWAAAQAALKLGKPEAAELLARAQNYRNLFDSETKFFRAKRADGTWVTPFDQWKWGDVYTEGGPWQFRFAAPHDVAGLAELYGGEKEMCAVMNQVHTTPSVFHTGSYRAVIHEMGEMTQNCWGQFMHNNQPTHPNLYTQIAAAGDSAELAGTCVDEARRYIKKAVNRLYTLNGYPGDEDNGEHGAWMVLSSLGLYDVVPGSASYVVGVPHFRRVNVTLGNGKSLLISAPDNCSTEDCYSVSTVTRNGAAQANRVSYEDIMDGGVFYFGIQTQEGENSAAVLPLVLPLLAPLAFLL